MLTSGNYTVYEVATAWDMTVDELKDLMIPPKPKRQALTTKVAVKPAAEPKKTQKRKKKKFSAPVVTVRPKSLKKYVQTSLEFPVVLGTGCGHLHVDEIRVSKYKPDYPVADIDLTTGWSEWELAELRIRENGVIVPKKLYI